MIPAALLQALNWALAARWIRERAGSRDAARGLLPLGLVAGAALAVYAIFLGSDGSVYGWLRRYGIRWDVLIMRPWGDYELSRDFKQSSLWDLRDYGFQVLLGIEDDRRNVEMLRSEGVPTLYRHSGYYD